MKKPDLSDSQPHVAEQLLNKSWGELETVEAGGYLLFPAEIYRRKKNGSFEATPIKLRVPREHENRKARVQARQIALKDGLDLDRDKDLVENLEVYCTLSMAMRNPKPMDNGVYEEFDPFPESLEKRYDKASMTALYSQLMALSELVNPQPNKISKEEMLALIAAIAKERNILPLAVFGPDSQASFIVSMAELLWSLLESKSSSDLSAPSTPG